MNQDDINKRKKGDSDLSPLGELLKKLYDSPDAQSEADEFWSSFEKKLDNESQIDEILNQHQEIKKDYAGRNDKLGKLLFFPFSKRNYKSEFHPEVMLETDENFLSNEERFWAGLSSYIDNEVSPEKHQEISHHLIDCAMCREKFNKLTKLSGVVKDNYQPAKRYNYIDDSFWDKLDQRLDDEFKVSTRKVPFKKLAVAASLVLALGLASFAGYKYRDEYNYMLPPEDSSNIRWASLGLTQAQSKRILEIENNWKEIRNSEEAIIEQVRSNLSKELAKEKPNLSLVDKYQRDILDHEIHMKREEVNSFMEKRFVLNESQTFKLFKQLQRSN